jgi:hypothetical protein
MDFSIASGKNVLASIAGADVNDEFRLVSFIIDHLGNSHEPHAHGFLIE